jgi:myo-inositol 2-dehydrogenase/D-chiro-inositol 1-dehydrogenase
MASERVGLVLVGAGRMGRVHLSALDRAAGIELLGVVEPVAELRAGLRARGLATFAGVEEMLARLTPEAVLIAAPTDRHAELVARFAAAGVHILCEKPLGLSAADAARAAMKAREADVVLQVGYWRRFVPALGALRERIGAGELGEIIQVCSLQWDAELPSEAFRAHSGGIAVDMGVHEIDQTRWLLGQEFAWVSAAAGPSSAPRPAGDPDAATILAGLSGGAAAVLSLGRRFPHADSCWIEIWGTDGYERIPFMWDADGDRVFRDGMRRQAEAFARAVRGGAHDGAGGADAVAALEVAELAAGSLTAGGAQMQRSALEMDLAGVECDDAGFGLHE